MAQRKRGSSAERAYGEAEVLLTAKNTSFTGLEEAGVIGGGEARRGSGAGRSWKRTGTRRATAASSIGDVRSI